MFADNAPDWTAMLSNYNGWTGADGIYTVNLDGKDYDAGRNPDNQRTFFIFSDTITGNVNPITDRRPSSQMPWNTSAILTGGKPDTTKITFRHPPVGTRIEGVIVPNPPIPATNGTQMYYWMGDNFVINNKLYIYALKIDTKPGTGFDQVGVDLVSYNITGGNIDYNSLTHYNDTGSRLSRRVNTLQIWHFGGAVFENTAEAGAVNPDGYIYIFGYYDGRNNENWNRDMILARVLPADITNFSEYRYLDVNNQWVNNMDNPKFLANFISPEFSVSQMKFGPNAGKFVLVNTHFTITDEVTVRFSDSLIAGFPNRDFNNHSIFLHDMRTAIVGRENTTYNAKAHPALSTERELFITYNMNGGGGHWDVFTFGNIYRPHFIRYAQVPLTAQY